ncbi:response regulator [Dankookia rubra]|uniref:Response regulator n=1 Tax=Dankookia rubra TaxID=1442381 RepID=A0A4R5Q833_9PROT|nr:response regulator [Dankookia rubra]TDH59092.1 response regulator [Dankookia rubra]
MTTVLVVDDEALIAMALEAALQDAGYQVTTAANGRQGLERLAEAQVDIVLLDMMMPVMNGPAMLRAMAADLELSGIPVIILSSLPEATVRAQADGVAAILRKPYTAGEVLRAIGQVLGEADQPGI